MKEPIKWHEQRLACRMDSLRRQEEQIKRMQADYDNNAKQALFLEYQIREAKNEGKDSFDEDRYRKQTK